MPATIFQEPGTDATENFAFWTSTTTSGSGAITSSTSQARTGPRSIQLAYGATAASTVYASRAGILTDAGARISQGIYFDTLPTGTAFERFMGIYTAAGTLIFTVTVSAAGAIRLTRNGGVLFTSANGLVSEDTWYRFALSYVLTSTSDWQLKLYLNGSQIASIDSSDILVEVGADTYRIGVTASSADFVNSIIYADDTYIDDGTDLNDPGNIQVTAKLPAAENTNNFDTAIGNGRGSTDYNNINERPLSETNGWQHAAATDVQENYGLETVDAGDEDLTNASLIARTAWVWAKVGSLAAISFVNAGVEGSAANGDITLGAPASPEVNDVWIAVIHSSDQVAHSFSDWTEIVQGDGGGTTSHLSVWYFRYAGSTPNLVVSHSAGQSPIGGILAFRGCKTSGSPVNVAGTIGAGTDESIEHTAITPTTTGCVLLVLNGSADDNNRTALGGGYAVAFEDSSGGTQNCYQTTAGTPDGSVSAFYDLDVAASDTGTVTVTQAATDAWASVLIALEPGSAGGSADIMDNGTETAIALTTTSALYTKTTDSAIYPSNAAGIGIRSTNDDRDTFLYECGTIVSYIAGVVQAAAVTVSRRFRMFRGLGR